MSNKINNSIRDSKSNPSSNGASTSLRSIQAMAIRAAIVAQTERNLLNENSKIRGSHRALPSQRCGRSMSAIQRDLKNIRGAFERACFERSEVRVSQPAAGSSAVCVITIWRKDPLRDSDNKVRVWRGTELSEEAHLTRKPADNTPERTYVFYPSSSDPERLGSVAIYGSDVVGDYESIRRKGCLFGIEVGAVSVEMGRRPFVDVTFRA